MGDLEGKTYKSELLSCENWVKVIYIVHSVAILLAKSQLQPRESILPFVIYVSFFIFTPSSRSSLRYEN